MAKIGRNPDCPCGSGRKFKRCCAGKSFDWVVREDGSAVQRLPVGPDLQRVLDSQGDVIRRHFEREPSSNDPIFPERYLYSDTDQERLMVEALRQAGVAEDKIYAYRKTKRLISASHLDNVSGAAIQEWDEAIAEFHAHGSDPLRNPEDSAFEALLVSLKEELTTLIFLFGFATDTYFNTNLVDDGCDWAVLSPVQFVGLCVAKTHRTLRAIKCLLENGLSDDALSLARSAYENYLHAIYVLNHPQGIHHLVDAVVGLENGTHAYEAVKGKLNKRVIIDLATQERLPGHISTFAMASVSTIPSDAAFFDVFYRKSSEILHPTVLRLDRYLSEKGLDAMTRQLDEEAILYSTLIGGMVMQLVRDLPRVPQALRVDMETVIKRLRRKISDAVEMLDTWQQRAKLHSPEIVAIRDRCSDQRSRYRANKSLEPTRSK
jgi:hypothetical protein